VKSVISIIAVMLTCAGASPKASLVEDGAALEKLAGAYSFTEGPAADTRGNVFFTDQPNDRIVKWNAADGTVADWLKPAGRSNGLYFDSHGNLLACADENNQLWSISPERKVTVLLKNFDGKLFNGPNDLWVHPDGTIYFTDPLYKRPYWKPDPVARQDGRHVFMLKAGEAVPFIVARGLKQPNGIIGTPDGKTLYIADIESKRTHAFDIASDGKLENQRLFCESGSDGMTIDERGNLYLTGKGVSVFNSGGTQIHHIEVPEPWTANLTFGGADRRLLFITASKGIYGLRMKVAGAPSAFWK
jgi:gluconolactonase